jgi:transcriptional regulator with XRE-family HTH domain
MLIGLPRRLARARQAWDLTQAQLARTAGVPHAMMISGWERGVNLPRVDYLTSMARVLGVSLDWLCGLTERGGPMERNRARPGGAKS